MTRILLVDDHDLVRQGIENLLSGIPDFKIVGSVSSGEEAINLIDEKDPHIVLLDIILPGMTGIETAKWIKDSNEEIKVILLSSEINDEMVKNALLVKVDGYLLKSSEKKEVVSAIRDVISGKRRLAGEATELLIEDFVGGNEKSQKKNTKLTKREEEVLHLVARGLGNQDIADNLFISIKTVEAHKSNILGKLNLKSTTALVRYAIKNGYE